MTGLSTVEFLSHLRSLNVKVFADHDRLRFNAPPGVITPDLKEELVARKGEIIKFLGGIPLSARMQPPPIERMPAGSEAQLSFSQERLWLLDQLEPGIIAYNIPTLFRLKGELNQEVLQQSLTELVRRHEILRTNYVRSEGRPLQHVEPPALIEIAQVDLRAYPEDSRRKEAARLLSARIALPFILGRDLPLRVSLFTLGPDEHGLLLEIHHIAFDGWSAGILVRELTVLYNAFLRGQPSPIADLSFQYVDFAAWQRRWLNGEVLETQLKYWKEKLAGNLPVLQLPSDRPRPAVQTYNGAMHGFQFPKWLTYALRKLCQQEGVTLFVVLLAAFKVLLLRYTGEDDILVGTPIANRRRPELEDLIGFFVNTMVMRTDMSGDPEFRTLIQRVQEMALGAYAHQDLPFEKLVEELRPDRDLSRPPIFQVMFTLLNTSTPRLELEGLEPTRVEYRNASAKFDLTLDLEETEEGLVGGWSYNTDLFDEATIVRMAEHFRNLLEAIVANPAERLSALPILGETERTDLLDGWNDTKVEYPAEVLLHELFEQQVERTPQAIALEFEGKRLTYGELNSRANQLARYLQENGVVADTLVGVFMERSTEMVVALYGILKAGGAYVPIDPEYPADRVAFMIEDAHVPVLLTQSHLVAQLPKHDCPVICLDTEWKGIAKASTENLARTITPKNLAYMIYTSGSTGKPKGAMNEHRGIVNRLLWMQGQYKLSEADTVLQKTPFSFDVSVWEFFWPLETGARLVVAKPGGHRDPAYLTELIVKQHVTTLHFVPPMLRMFLEEPEVKRCKSLRHVVCSGEALPYDLQEKFFKLLPAQLHNLYGPTEAAVDVTHWTCERNSTRKIVPIGRPVANTQIYIVDANFQPVPIGVTGELYIGGVQVGRGYHNRPELTAEKFITDPFSNNPEARLYKTGDVCRWLSDGSIEYLGRADFQVKIRGFRVELGEIEALLSKHELVKTCMVIAREDVPGDKRLVAYMVYEDGKGPSEDSLREYLKQDLPEFMVPWAFVTLDAMPVTPNGKVDRKALPAPAQQLSAHRPSYVAPVTEVEVKLAALWAEVLRLDRVGIFDNFFQLGGHSLLAVALASKVEKAFGKRLPLASFIQAPTILEFSKLIDASAGKSPWSPLVKLSAGGTKQPIFLMHSHGGNILEYHQLASRLGQERPVYALQARGLDGTPVEPQSIEEMAADYIKQIKTVQPHGPYYLGGYCLGGMLAIEAAQQLRAQGESVPLVAMLHTATRKYLRYPQSMGKLQQVYCTAMSRSALEFHNLTRTESGEGVSYAVTRLKRIRDVFQARFEMLLDRFQASSPNGAHTRSMIYHLEQLGIGIERAGIAYQPQAYEGKVLMLRAQRQPHGIHPDAKLGWAELLQGEVEVKEVPDFRQNMLDEPNVLVVASMLADSLHEVERGTARPELSYQEEYQH